ncbi:hypothetical protein F5B20DRAFT_518826 [Whalleya microplaca]|nr:hypothetical protein F5B20DRAFT_518826 [Whalleya microplaca]
MWDPSRKLCNPGLSANAFVCESIQKRVIPPSSLSWPPSGGSLAPWIAIFVCSPFLLVFLSWLVWSCIYDRKRDP